MKGKVAVVTGSTSGIGWGLAGALAEAGADVMLHGLGDPAEVERLRAGLAARTGVRVAAHQADLSRAEEVTRLIRDTEAALGGIDILVNNAGIQYVSPVEDFPPERWTAVQNIILNSSFHAIRETVPGMRQRGWGRIINLASVHGLVASPFKSAYVAAKHGIVGLTKVTALENASTGVTCNAICPGWVLTPLVQKQVDAKAAALKISNEEAKKLLLGEKEPSMQFTTPDELGELAVFFCSAAGNNVRGVAWNMDGGWVAQ